MGEVKWGYFSAGDLRKFQRKIKRIPFEADKDIQYILFSGKGFQTEIPPGFKAICGEDALQ
ncbi:MAG: hypothetical protein KAW12_21115 [Candidatus Aminicenantes bacterium]|nr:hypothetical protein [Candidatus Aminicenantes bacterium]